MCSEARPLETKYRGNSAGDNGGKATKYFSPLTCEALSSSVREVGAARLPGGLHPLKYGQKTCKLIKF